ncbi:SDR family NAD(P)-dependent oxidoreductase [Agrococcus sp. TSP3-2-1]|uniref:SDR family NAD(P)-dependent oxidoreductase n=1 Tax=Agrococcus sp. TSP3-2-1 TaxID=2804583 RepID=UPI003CFA7D05
MSVIDLTGKVAVITGGGSGIGRATAQLFAELGAKVVVSDIAQTADETVASIEGAGGTASAMIGDIGDVAVADSVVAAAVERYGRLDVLVNNAGIMDHFAGAANVEDALWDRIMRVNLDAPFYLTRAALKVMLPQGSGSIVNVSSAAGIRGAAAGAAYTASKHGLVGLTRNTAYMYGKQGIRANAICPGGVATNVMTEDVQRGIDHDGLAALGPIHQGALRNAEPIEQANLAAFLASDAASNVNGAIIPNDGGWAAG